MTIKKRIALAAIVFAFLSVLPAAASAQKPIERIYHAWYGIEDGPKVENPNLVESVRARLQNGVLSIPGNMNESFGDPAPGRPKVLAIYVKYTDGTEAHLRAPEGRDFVHGATIGWQEKPVANISDGWYGADNQGGITVGVLVRTLISRGVINFPADLNAVFGDPAPGYIKILKVNVRHMDGTTAELRITAGTAYRYGSLMTERQDCPWPGTDLAGFFWNTETCGYERDRPQPIPVPVPTPVATPVAAPTPITAPTPCQSSGERPGFRWSQARCRYESVASMPVLTPDISGQAINLALKPGVKARSSSVDFGGSASRAIDGNTDGTFANNSVTHTRSEQNPWLEVDLGAFYMVEEVRLYNRTDCCQERWAKVQMEGWIETNQRYTTEFRWTYTSGTELMAFRPKSGGLAVRYVRVLIPRTEFLSLAEIVILGKDQIASCGAHSGVLECGIYR